MQNELNNNQESFCKKAKMSLFTFPITKTDSITNITPFDILVKVKSTEFQPIVEKIHGIKNKEERDGVKALSLPSFTPSGLYSKRNQDNFIQHSGILCVDFDNVSDLDDLKNKLLSDKEIETLLLFLSPSGNGYKWFVRIPPNELTHILYFEAIENYLKSNYYIEIDKSCKNISRACYLSFDPNAYLNFGNPKELDSNFLSKWKSSLEKQELNLESNDFDKELNLNRVKLIVDQIVLNQINIAEDYEEWLKIGFSLCQLGEDGRFFFHEISKQSGKYKRSETDRKYDSISESYDGQISLGTFFFIAKQNGIELSFNKIKEVKLDEIKSNYETLESSSSICDRLNNAKKLPKLTRLLGNIWCKGEIHILFADNGTGKSVWATQIADDLSKGRSTFEILPNHAPPQRILFYDFELSDIQLLERYSNEFGNTYPFHPNLIMPRWDFNDPFFFNKKEKFNKLIIKKIKRDIEIFKPDVLVIDNITFLSTEATQDANVALELLRALIDIKNEFKISILVLAHTPKIKPGFQISNNDLAGSKHLSNLVDSVSAIGVSATDKNIKYIKSIKCRSTQKEFDSKNVIMVKQEKVDCFLRFTYLGQGNELQLIKDKSQIAEEEFEEDVKMQVINLYLEQKSIRKIAEETGLSKSKVDRIIQNYRLDQDFES
jgi:archaellum biogenesis ATPase FlaH